MLGLLKIGESAASRRASESAQPLRSMRKHFPGGTLTWSPDGEDDGDAQLALGWETAWTDDGSKYYHHLESGETRWDAPLVHGGASATASEKVMTIETTTLTVSESFGEDYRCHYVASDGTVQGPFSMACMRMWFADGHFKFGLMIWVAPSDVLAVALPPRSEFRPIEWWFPGHVEPFVRPPRDPPLLPDAPGQPMSSATVSPWLFRSKMSADDDSLDDSDDGSKSDDDEQKNGGMLVAGGRAGEGLHHHHHHHHHHHTSSVTEEVTEEVKVKTVRAVPRRTRVRRTKRGCASCDSAYFELEAADQRIRKLEAKLEEAQRLLAEANRKVRAENAHFSETRSLELTPPPPPPPPPPSPSPPPPPPFSSLTKQAFWTTSLREAHCSSRSSGRGLLLRWTTTGRQTRTSASLDMRMRSGEVKCIRAHLHRSSTLPFSLRLTVSEHCIRLICSSFSLSLSLSLASLLLSLTTVVWCRLSLSSHSWRCRQSITLR